MWFFWGALVFDLKGGGAGEEVICTRFFSLKAWWWWNVTVGFFFSGSCEDFGYSLVRFWLTIYTDY